MSERNRNVEEALAALRAASAAQRAPDAIEARLLREFRRQHKSWRKAWIAGALAASLAVAVTVRWPRAEVKEITTAPVPQAIALPAPPVARPPAPVRAAKRRIRKPEPKRELATEFFAIPYAPAMTHVDRGQLIRVAVPAMSMRNFGLPVREERMLDRVRADVLMGEDGIARAIRFVR
jgi:hypothetical protein